MCNRSGVTRVPRRLPSSSATPAERTMSVEPVLSRVFAANEVLSVTLIDGGDTIAVRLRTADGGELGLLLPLPLGPALVDQIYDAAAAELAARQSRGTIRTAPKTSTSDGC